MSLLFKKVSDDKGGGGEPIGCGEDRANIRKEAVTCSGFGEVVRGKECLAKCDGNMGNFLYRCCVGRNRKRRCQ